MKIKTRALLLLWHRWFGIVAAVWLLAMAVTGAVLVFYDELDQMLNPDLHLTQSRGPVLPVARWVDAAAAYQPQGFVRTLHLPATPQAAVFVELGARPHATDPDVDGLTLYLDPYTAEILGERQHGVLRLDRRHIMNVIYELHLDLLLGPPMLWFLGLVSLLWIIDHVISFCISFTVLARWARSFRIRFAAGGYKTLFDLHRAGGLWIFPVTLMFAVSGLYFNWYDSVVHAVDQVSPLTPRYIFTLPDVEQPLLPTSIDTNIDMAAALALAASGDAKVDMASFLPEKRVFEVRVFDPRDIDPYGRRLLVIDAVSGKVLSDHHVTEGGAGNVFLAWMYPLHSGKAFGWPGRILVFICGLILIGIVLSGVKIMLHKRSVWRQANAAV
jgi:uncharacterized iron-regulated membrane protein